MSGLGYRPQVVPATATPRARQLALIAHLIPAAMWSSYGDIGEAGGGNGRGTAKSLSSVSPLFTKASYAPGDDWSWCLPWHRIRDADGREVSRTAGTFQGQRIAFADEVYAHEGGRFVAPGVADPAQRFDIVGKVAEFVAAGLWPWERVRS